MSMLKDPYDYIEWNPDRKYSISSVSDYKEEKRWRRKRGGRAGKQWLDYVYDLIAFLMQVAILATLFKLSLR